MCFHKFNKWEDLESIETFMNTGGAVIQTCSCKECNYRKLRRTNSIRSSDSSVVGNILHRFIMKLRGI
jgi:hypothetical protein